MLEFQVTQANFKFGVAEDQEPHQVPPGTLLTAENVVWKKSGRIEKRLGSTALTRSVIGGGTLSAAARLFTRGDELCVIDGASLYAYAAAAGAWRKVDTVPDVGLTWRSTLVGSGVAAADTAVSSAGLLVHAWVTGDPTSSATSGGLCVQVLGAATGTQVLPPQRLAFNTDLTHVRVVVLGTKAIVMTRIAANITAYLVDLSALTITAGVNLATDASTGSGLDACVIGASVVVCYVDNTGASCMLRSFDATLAPIATATVENGASDIFASIDGAAGETLYVLYLSSAGLLRLAIHDANSLVQRVAPQTIEDLISVNGCEQLAVCRYDATHAVVSYTCYATRYTDLRRTMSMLVSQTGSVSTTSTRGTWGTRLLTRPFMLGSKCYAFALDNPATDITTNFNDTNSILLELGTSATSLFVSMGEYVPHRYVGKVDTLIGGMTSRGSLPNVVVTTTTGERVAAIPFLAEAPELPSGWDCGTRLVRVTTGAAMPSDTWRAVTYGQEAYLAGAVASVYDGRSVFDYSFPRAPVWLTPITNTGSVDVGVHIYAVGYEYRGAAAVLHRGPISTYTFTILGSPVSVDANLSGGSVGNKAQDVDTGAPDVFSPVLAVYRSVAGSTIPQRLMTGAVVLQQDQVASFSDTVPDADIGGGVPLATRPVVYTTGGILEDEQAPALTTMTLHGQRLWGIDGSGVQAWYSKSFLDDYGVAPGFSTAFRIQFDVPVTALVSVDEKLIAFASDRIWAVLGDGPAPDGSNGDFQVTPIQTSVGCSNPRSVVSMADGVMFQSARGFYMVTRKLEVVFVGGAVQDQLAAFPNVTSAVLVAKRNEVRFTCDTADGSAGTVLSYNYVQQQWSTSRYTANGVYGCPFADACIWQGQWTAATPDGFVLQETDGTYLDDTAWVPMTIETAWISAAGPVGYACVDTMSLGGVSKSNHDLSVAVGFDGEDTYAQAAVTFLAGSPVTSIGPLEQCSVSIGTRRRCQAIRFKITDATPTNPGAYPVGTGQGVSLDTMGLELGIEKGLRRLPATKKG